MRVTCQETYFGGPNPMPILEDSPRQPHVYVEGVGEDRLDEIIELL
jgi:hypothetical protein